MNFLVDAHLPRRLARFLSGVGHDALHTLDLPFENSTSDADINQISMDEERIVVTKDSDFVDSYLLNEQPYKLLLVGTGNIRNDDLMTLFEQNIERIVEAFDTSSFIEIDQQHITIHY